MNTDDLKTKLDTFYKEVYQTILVRQDPLTGLFPASTDINEHGDYTDAWVRDNVYTIQAVWGLALAYRKSGCDNSRAYTLEQTVVKLMRGLLMSMLRQAAKVEVFKVTQNPMDALHAKYNTQSGTTVVGDDQWGHLQLDATAIFLLMLSQMTKTGLRIVFTIDEVNFVQNLVHYIGRAYRTPDYGIWERGNKINNGAAEINASSVGMAKAALESMNRLNLFGEDGSSESVIHIMADEIARSRTTLHALLPRESHSKEVDSAVLSIIGYPAFAIEDDALVERTRKRIIDKLGGRYGCKRFLLDGHQTVMEDEHRLHYESEELKNFANIESEWPLFFTYLMLDAVFRGDEAETESYRKKLEDLLVEKDGMLLLPELFFVPHDKVEAEKANPKSQDRVANNNLPLIWAQSLFLLGRMIADGVLDRKDIDPLERHKRIGKKLQNELQFCVIAENEEVQQKLTELDISSTKLEDTNSIKIMYPNELANTLHRIGANEKLGLTGRPKRRMRALATSRLYELNGDTALFLPQVQNRQDFYFELDNRILIEEMRTEFAYITRHWDDEGQPIQAFLVTPDMLAESGTEKLISFIREIKNGEIEQCTLASFEDAILKAGKETIVNVPKLPEYCPVIGSQILRNYVLSYDSEETQQVSISAINRLDEQPSRDQLIHELSESKNLYRQVKILQTLLKGSHIDSEVTLANQKKSHSIKTLLEEVYQRSCSLHLWSIVRLSAGLLGKSHYGLADAVTELLVNQKFVIVGRAYNSEGVIKKSEPNKGILRRIKACCLDDGSEEMIHQEVLLFLSYILKSDPEVFRNMLSIRTNEFIHLVVARIANEQTITHGEAFDILTSMSPQEIQTRLKMVVNSYNQTRESMKSMESLSAECNTEGFNTASLEQNKSLPSLVDDWSKWRIQFGAIKHIPQGFYKDMRDLLTHCKGIVLGDKFDSSNRVDSSYVLGSMTAGEPAFAHLFDALLNDIPAADYRHLTLETILALASFFEANPDIIIQDYLVIDVIIGHGVRLNWLEHYPALAQTYDDKKASAWELFYQSRPEVVAKGIIRALEFLLEEGKA
ncbi:MAG: glycoside hydrolase family 15 protein [Lentisphaeraceae bacterium]|nr:glycoside hydrolase family 15 protein [Lentisphaeraceae bacterium]